MGENRDGRHALDPVSAWLAGQGGWDGVGRGGIIALVRRSCTGTDVVVGAREGGRCLILICV